MEGQVNPEGIQAAKEIVARMMAMVSQTIHSSEEPSSTYKCEKCHDGGWLWHADEEGRRYASKCVCQLAREAEYRMQRSGLADTVDCQTFDTFITRTPIQRQMKQTARKYLEVLLDPVDNPRRPWLYIGGNPGSGKTHICTAVCGELLKHNIGVRYMQWLNESRRLKYGVNSEDFEEEVADYIGVPVLYIDDLLKQKYTQDPRFSDADIKIAFTILNARYLQNKPTIISSEWDLLDHLLAADEGVFSRVYERCKGYTVSIARRQENNFRLTGEAEV